MIITKATYGGKDVTEIIKSLISKDKLNFKVSNIIFGDPTPRIFKYLDIVIDDKKYSVPENEFFIYPISSSNKLGIFYTNNNVPKVVSYCLNDLSKFNNIADIISCVWEPIKDNQFIEIMSMTKSSNHLNIIVQILQLLYFAQQQPKTYEYVAFLEHDVLYPEDYFDFTDFDDAIVNMNYMGLCPKGFQSKTQNDTPLHQIVMKFDFALNHFQNLIHDAIKFGSVIVEPKNLITRECKNPSLHINHKKHFTTHHYIYSATEIYEKNNYWGDGPQLMQKALGGYE